jgi:ABC-type methionine transport system ATPase subunit
MSDQVIRLVYPANLLHLPIINQLIRRFDLTLNILRAQIGEGQAWMDVQLAGDPVVIEDAVAWLKSQGVDIQVQVD